MKKCFSVVIIEDDDVIRSSLLEEVDWSQLGCCVVASAGNGIDGIEVIEKHEPDLVVSDILMPIMDGLSMLREVHNRNLHFHTILLTGHEEFEAARQAIELHVDRYLTKPLDLQAFHEAVSGIVSRMHALQVTEEQVQNSLPILRQTLVMNVLFGRWVSEADLIEQIAFAGAALASPYYAVCIGRVSQMGDGTENRFQDNTTSRHIIKTSVAGLCRARLGEFPSVEVCDYRSDDESFSCIVGVSGPGNGRPHEKLVKTCEEIIALVSQDFHCDLTIGIGGIHEGLRGISISFQEARKASDCAHIVGTGRVILLDDVSAGEPIPLVDRDVLIARLIEALRLTDRMRIAQCMESLQESMTRAAGTPMLRIRMDASAVAFAIMNEVDSWLMHPWWAGDAHELEQYMDRFYTSLQRAVDVRSIVSLLKDLALHMMGIIESNRQSHHSLSAQKILKYIDDHFTDVNLSLASTAEKLSMSQSYLCMLLKKERNTTFQTYVTGMRMARAQELLRNNTYKVYEIAEKVGYSNAQYFSYVFKKTLGMTPLQFSGSTQG